MAHPPGRPATACIFVFLLLAGPPPPVLAVRPVTELADAGVGAEEHHLDLAPAAERTAEQHAANATQALAGGGGHALVKLEPVPHPEDRRDAGLVQLASTASGALIKLSGSSEHRVATATGAEVTVKTRGWFCNAVKWVIQKMETFAKKLVALVLKLGMAVTILAAWAVSPWLGDAVASAMDFGAADAVGNKAGWFHINSAWGLTKVGNSVAKVMTHASSASGAAAFAGAVPIIGLVMGALSCVKNFCDFHAKLKNVLRLRKDGAKDNVEYKKALCEVFVDGAKLVVGLLFTALGIAATVGSFGAAALAMPVVNLAWSAGWELAKSNKGGYKPCNWMAERLKAKEGDNANIVKTVKDVTPSAEAIPGPATSLLEEEEEEQVVHVRELNEEAFFAKAREEAGDYTEFECTEDYCEIDDTDDDVAGVAEEASCR